ncbi:PAS domain S-box protein [Halopiger goleimassiliensis]|uniref:PAS domain S-box protein n=1 Tax=Halopiger goleimassiliensis TaxID=1293048 RepID=UPI00067822D0|nr:PAS domain S-box protein [Halopiger goleimassiliensis]
MRYSPRRSRSRRDRPAATRSGHSGRGWLLAAVAVLVVLVAIRAGLPGEGFPIAPLFVGLAVSSDDDRSALQRLTDDVETVVERFGDVDATNPDGIDDWDVDVDRSDEVGDLAAAVDELTSTMVDRTRQLAESERYRRAVHEITSDTDASSEAKIRRLLELGCERLGVESGFVARIDEERGDYEVERAVGDLVEEGLETDLERTYCRDAIDAEDILTLYNAPEQGYADHPGYEDAGIGCYVGGRIEVDGELYGTVCFVDREPRSAFSGPERTFVDLVTRWVSHVYDRREYERRLRLKDRALEEAPVGVTITDPDRPDNPIVYANASFEEITGYAESECRGRNCRFLQGEATDPDRVEELREAIETEEPTTVELRNYRADGTEFWNRVSVAPIGDDDGEVTNYVGFQEDVTDRKEHERELEETNEWLDAVIQASPAALIAVDLEDRVQLWNPGAERIFGWSEEEVLGEPLPTIPEGNEDEYERYLDRLRAGETVTGVELQRQTKDGSLIEVSLSKAPIHGPDGEVVGMMGALEEITERKEAERALRERERRLQEYKEFTDGMLDAIDDAFYVIDADGDLIRWNETVAAASGYSHEEIAEMDPVEFFVDDDRDEITAAIDRAFETGSSRVEVSVRRHDGERVPYEFVASRLEDPDGNPVVAGVGRDVSDRVAKERELERYREFTDEMLDAIDDVFYVLDADGGLLRWNETVTEVTGYTDDEVTEMDALEFFGEEGREIIRDSIEETFETGDTRVEAPYRTKDGERIPYEFVASRVEDPEGNPVEVGIGRDISDRKRYERELERTTRMLEQSQQLASVGAWELDVREAPYDVTWTEEVARIHGLESSADLDLDRALEFYHPEDRPIVERAVERAIEGGEPYDHELRIRTADGERRWVRTIGEPVREDGEVVKLQGSFQDITDRKRRERELERYETIIQAIGDPVYTLDPSGEFRFVNDAVESLLGYEPAEVIGTNVSEVLPPADFERSQELVRELRREGDPYGTVEATLETADGDRIDAEIHVALLPSDDGEFAGTAGVVRDITDRKERERELERTRNLLERVQEMARIGGWELDVRTDPPTAEWTDELYRMHGLPTEVEPDLDTIVDCYHPDDRAFVRETIQESLENGTGYELEARMQPRPGETRWVRAFSEPIFETDDGRRVVGTPAPNDAELIKYQGAVHDVTDLKRRERDLERTTDLLKRVQRMAGVGGWELDTRTEPRLADWTDELYRLHYLSPDVDPDLETTIDCYHPEDRAFVREQIRTAIDEQRGYEYEARIQSDEGDVRWVRARSEPIFEDGDLVKYRGTVKDVTEQKERERELQQTRALLERVEDLASIGGWELDLRTDPPTPTWTKEQYRLHGFSPEMEPDLEAAIERYHPDDRPKVRRTLADAIAGETNYELEARLQPSPDETRWVRGFGAPVYEDGELVKYQGALQDITPQKERELALESLHEAARGLLATESAAEVADVVVEAADDVLEASGVALYQLEDEHNRLEPIAHTDGFEALSSGTPAVAAGAGDSVLWNAFVAGAQTVVDDPTAFDRSQVFGPKVERAVVAPVGDHGVVTVAAESEPIDGDARRLIETLVATAEAAFDRLESEASLRERDAELESQNRRLRRQIAVNETIRRINQSLVGATSRAEIERTVPERLLEDDRVAFAWIGSADDDRLEPQAWAGTDAAYLDRVSLEPATSGEPASRTARTGEATVVENVVADLQSEPWRREALDAGFQSVVSVPLAVEEYTYGVLTVYATEPDAFTDLERTVFGELGEAIANAITATKTREALQAETVIELTLSVTGGGDVLSRIADRTDAEVVYEGLGTQSSEQSVVFFETQGVAPEAVEGVLEDLVSVSEYRLISDDDGVCRFEAHVTGDLLAAQLVRHGASPRQIRADGTETVVVADVPVGTDVREFVDTVTEEYGTVELRRRRHVERAMHTRRELVSSLFDDLTDRQLEVLRTAYFAGFFEWPRESTGEDVATMLDVSQPTVNRHLRIAQQRLLTQLFGTETAETAD